ncbi:MAG: DegT/DnrJ/EryC1/StrS family aminotransferase [Spongiibacteraceae bacterium]
MSWRVLPPAGHPMVLHGAAAAPEFAGYRATWVQSGTAALALALIAARRRSPQIENPAVILPGYACPDLVAAALFANVQPILVDIGCDDPGYDLTALRAAMSPSVVAVVAVNFLGVSERIAQLREIISACSTALLIEDNAQWFPEPFPQAALQGDLVCLSFGRGKPVSLLGGGVLLAKNGIEMPEIGDIVQPAMSAGSAFFAKACAYNALLSPRLYGLVSRLPFLQLGVTKLKPLSEIRAMDLHRQGLLAANIHTHLQRSQHCSDALQALIPNSILDIASRAADRRGRLLRYPVLLADRDKRDNLLARLQHAGLGATALYQCVLPEITGVAPHVHIVGALNGAKAFAARLLTLPVHSGVSAADVEKLREQLRNAN